MFVAGFIGTPAMNFLNVKLEDAARTPTSMAAASR